MTWPAPMPIAEVSWVDARAKGCGWLTPENWDAELGDTPLECRSVGYLRRDDERGVLLMQSRNSAGHLADALELPRAMVRHVRVMEAAHDPD